MPLFPARTTKTLRYSGNFGLSSTSGVVASYVLRANDLFDPDFTGTGHQPMGFDQMMVFYNHFCVTHARLVVTAKAATGTASTVAVRVDASSTPLTVIDQIIEFGGLVQVELESIGNFGANKVLELRASIPKLQGVSMSAMTADPTLRGDAATSPTEISYFHIQCWNAAGVTSAVNISFILEQRAVFMEPRDATESFLRAPVVESKLDSPVVVSLPTRLTGPRGSSIKPASKPYNTVGFRVRCQAHDKYAEAEDS
jgi:hypothetical protein